MNRRSFIGRALVGLSAAIGVMKFGLGFGRQSKPRPKPSVVTGPYIWREFPIEEMWKHTQLGDAVRVWHPRKVQTWVVMSTGKEFGKVRTIEGAPITFPSGWRGTLIGSCHVEGSAR